MATTVVLDLEFHPVDKVTPAALHVILAHEWSDPFRI